MKGWIIGLVTAGVAIAIVLGVFGRSETRAQSDLCANVGFLRADINSLKNLQPSTASKGTYQSTINTIQGDWNEIRAGLEKVTDINQQQLQDAWSQYVTAVRNIPDTAAPADAVSQLKQHTQALATTVQQSIGDLDCSSS